MTFSPTKYWCPRHHTFWDAMLGICPECDACRKESLAKQKEEFAKLDTVVELPIVESNTGYELCVASSYTSTLDNMLQQYLDDPLYDID